jgi:dienelactone hydrolase
VVALLAAACAAPESVATKPPATSSSTSTTINDPVRVSTTKIAPTTTTSTLPPLASPTTPYRVGSRTFDWFDESRSTPAHGRYHSHRGREIVTVIWYPAQGAPSTSIYDGAAPAHTGGPFPVVLFAHGHGGEPADYRTDIFEWVSRGYVVVAPEFPLGNRRTPGGAIYADLPNQPGDLSYTLSRVLGANADPTSWLHGVIDPRRVGAIGHSSGAWTVLALVANTCCRDHHITAAIILAGEMSNSFTGRFYKSGAPPLLFVHAVDDPTVPYAAGEQAYLAAPRPKYFFTLKVGDHATPYLGYRYPEGTAALHVTDEFLDRYLRDIKTVAITNPNPGLATLKSRQ